MVGVLQEDPLVLSSHRENCHLSLELGFMGLCPLIQSIMQIASCQREMLCLRSATVESLILQVMLEPCKIADVIWDDQQVPIVQMNVEKSLFKYNEYCILKCCDVFLYTDIDVIWAISSISEWTCLLVWKSGPMRSVISPCSPYAWHLLASLFLSFLLPPWLQARK